MAQETKKNSLDFYTRENISTQEILLKVTLPADAFTASYKQLLDQQLKSTNIKGFRKGHTPTDLLEKDLKPAILIETFERIAPYYVNSAIINEALQPIAPPEYQDLGDLDTNKAIRFSVKVTIMPKFKLGNLKKIKVKREDPKATKEEIDNTIKTMFDNNKSTLKSKEIGDKWAAEVGKLYKFEEVKTVKDLEKVVSDAVESQKKLIVEREATTKAVKEAVKLSKIEIPEEAVHYEAHEREHAFKHDVEKMGMTVDEFCKRQNVTIEELRDRWHKDAHEALENDVLFKLYAEDRKVEISAEDIEAEVERMKKAAKEREGAKFDESGYDDPNWREHIRSFMVKQKAYEKFVEEVLPSPKAESKKSAKKK